MRAVKPLPSFERSSKNLTFQEKEQLAKSLENFNDFLLGKQVPYGFRFKKINKNKYEFRVDRRLRVVVKEEGDIFYLVLVGSHDQIRRYLRCFR